MRSVELFDGSLSMLGVLGRIGYISRVSSISKLDLSAYEAATMRNVIKVEYRGPLAKPLRSWHMKAYDELVQSSKSLPAILKTP